jgi:hypothetical protein
VEIASVLCVKKYLQHKELIAILKLTYRISWFLGIYKGKPKQSQSARGKRGLIVAINPEKQP